MVNYEDLTISELILFHKFFYGIIKYDDLPFKVKMYAKTYYKNFDKFRKSIEKIRTVKTKKEQ